MDIRMHPKFLCIGAQKAGTSWLYKNLSYHPDVWLPPRKEIHYFDDPFKLPLIISFFHPRTYTNWRIGLKRLKKYYQKNDRTNVNWYLKYLLSPRSNSWYRSLYKNAGDKVSGDITPYYSVVSENRIKKIKECFSDIKVIYLLRNPIERTWSQTVMHFAVWHKKNIDEIPIRSIIRYLNKKSPNIHSNYYNNLKNWIRYFSMNQIFIGYFDQLISEPNDLIQSIYKFLSLESNNNYVSKNIKKKINTGNYSEIPEGIKRLLCKKYQSQIFKLSKLFNNKYIDSWLEYTRNYV